ncbi:hypothetical protein IMZ48_31780 [Candidatus Bathyarchaeota archaeon]|nr:hypothetical protein [Candidatus Bathyarchaeota archaeon]
MTDKAPWDMRTPDLKCPILRTRVHEVIYTLAEAIRVCSILLLPYMPEKAGKALDKIGVQEERRTFEHAARGADLMYGRGLFVIEGRGPMGSLFEPMPSLEYPGKPGEPLYEARLLRMKGEERRLQQQDRLAQMTEKEREEDRQKKAHLKMLRLERELAKQNERRAAREARALARENWEKERDMQEEAKEKEQAEREKALFDLGDEWHVAKDEEVDVKAEGVDAKAEEVENAKGGDEKATRDAERVKMLNRRARRAGKINMLEPTGDKGYVRGILKPKSKWVKGPPTVTGPPTT